ncbi:MAG TPA: His-Xaa-Ser system radical SAM maturase HxsC [Chthoniobacterales bacterium]|nr:His-Xaa-Ser system radical SAM maturase HxsC [Chthoniobacterales bacterium]
MLLSAKIPKSPGSEPFIVRIADSDSKQSGSEATVAHGDEPLSPNRFKCVLRIGEAVSPDEISIPKDLEYLSPGDIVRVNREAGEIRVLYRRNSPHNTLFFTERCNSRCLMCSQPPRAINDDHLIEDILEAIPLMSSNTPEICITGGEPTLLGERFLAVVEATKQWLPNTSLHVLSNGRLFSMKFARQVAAIRHRNLMIGIPLYSDVASKHDFVVQAEGAFDETVRGIMNLERCDQRVEIRVVIHKQTSERLPQTARFIARNIPFVAQVALMGLEMIGFTKTNLDAIWIDPADYQSQLSAAVSELRQAGINVMIYNHQLCVLSKELWPFARKSISDWKNIYMRECDECCVRDSCGGFFASAPLRYSSHIKSVTKVDRQENEAFFPIVPRFSKI